MPVGKPLRLRLFIEGIEIPVIGATVAVNENGPAASSIQVIPLDEATLLKPRSMVHLFFLDTRSTIQNGQTTGTLANYRLLFSGETIGFSVVLKPDGRETVLQCVDFSSYLDTAHTTAIEYGPTGNAFNPDVGTLDAGNTQVFDDIINTQSMKMLEWVKEKPETPGLTGVSGLAGGVIRMIEAIVGLGDKHVKGVNDFFTVAELRCRILAQISAEEHDNTAANLFDVQVFEDWLRNGFQNVGQQATIRDLIKMLFNHVYYDTVPNPAAKFDPSIKGSSTEGPSIQIRLGASTTGRAVIADLKRIESLLIEHVGSDNSVAIKFTAENSLASITDDLASLNTLSLAEPNYAKAVGQAKLSLQKIIASLQAAASASSAENFAQTAQSINKVYTDISQSTDSVVQKGTKTTNSKSARLRSQIMRPDCWFVPPPRCNVIFPEQYSMLSFDRNYLSEVTRSLIQFSNLFYGNDQLFTTRVLAPVSGTDINNLAKQVGEAGYRVLLDHELHTGIIPRTEWLPDSTALFRNASKPGSDIKGMQTDREQWARNVSLFNFFKFRFGPRQVSVAGHFNPNIVCGFPALIITRPYIVPGISVGGNVSDQSVLDSINDNAIENGAPYHYLGMVQGLQHSVNQGGGTTSYSLHHARQHLGVDDEYLSVVSKIKTKPNKRLKIPLTFQEASNSTDPRLLKLLEDVTPQTPATPKKKVSTTSVSTTQVSFEKQTVRDAQVFTDQQSESISRSSQSSQTVEDPQFVARGKIDGIDRDLWVPSPNGAVGVESSGLFGKIVGVEVLAPPGSTPQTTTTSGGKRVFVSVVIYEEVPSQTEEVVNVEDILRPGWLSTAYKNENIGSKIYQPFFGVDSIVDELSFLGLGSNAATPNNPEGLQISASSSSEAIQGQIASTASVSKQLSIQRAVNLIGFLYGAVVANGLDVHEFVQSFTFRPIATLEDMLGSADLQLLVSGTDVSVQQGSLGFHSLAVNPQVVNTDTKLVGLLEDPEIGMKRINDNGQEAPVPPRFDVRRAKKDRVQAYADALIKGRAFRG